MIDFDNSDAFRAFDTDHVVVTGKRYENGVTRDVKLSCSCCLLIGDVIETNDRAFGVPDVFDSSVEIFKANWPDHTPPQKGDLLDFGTQGSATVTRVPIESATTYVINCVFKRR